MSKDIFSGAHFDPEQFRHDGHKIIDLLSDYLVEVTNRPDTPVLPWADPDELAALYEKVFIQGDDQPFHEFIRDAVNRSNHLHHPRYIGHQVTSPLPRLALVHLCTALLNNGAAIYEMGPVAMAMEKNLIKYFAGLIGYGTDSDGIFTHGGSAGNLTAMLAIRQVKSDYNVWEEGIRSDMRTGFMATDQAHYSVARNIKIMGLGDESLITVPADNRYKMKTDCLEETYRKAVDKGIRVAAVVAGSCSTATGSYDDIEAIAGFCERHNLWLHVDGAHGMGVLFSDKYRHLKKGIERADSVVIDLHKMLLVPGLNTMVLFRNGRHSYETFAQKASYLFEKQTTNEWYNSAKRTLECTKSSLGIIAFTAFKYFDRNFYCNYIEGRYDLAARFARQIATTRRFQLLTQPESNIVCFRYNPGDINETELNRLNARLRESIIREGTFYIVQTEIKGALWLRVTIINPLTSDEDLERLLIQIEKKAAEESC